MADPVLLAHKVKPGIFQIGGKMTPISIRDQMLRAFVLVDRALESGLISSTRPLLVVGAGAAGATAAIHAANNDVEAVLIDKNLMPFGRQRRSRRWVSPTQYDWPVNHWSKETFPWGEGPSMPLWWRASRASTLAQSWHTELEDARIRLGGRLVILPKNLVRWSSVRQVPVRMLEVDFTRTGGPKKFGMMLSCVGVGSEDTKIGDYKGFRFWDRDKFEEQYLGINPPMAPQVLISGGGDGALQDFLRIVTKERSVSDIYRSLDLPPEEACRIEHRILSAEDQANRAHIWSTTEHDHPYNELVQQKHQGVVDELAAGPLWGDISGRLRVILSRAQFKFNVELAHSCTHFSKCYGLNRFLVLLLLKYFQEEHSGYTPLRQNRKIKEISGVGPHVCRLRPKLCLGEAHQVTFEEADCSGKKTLIEVADKYYNVIVVRHGIDEKIPRKHQLALNPRHLLPYYSAW